MSEKKATEREQRSVSPWDPFMDLAAVERWAPLREFGLSGRLSRLMDEMWGERGRGHRGFAPALDIAENEGAYVVTVELPGVAKEDVHVEIEEGVLTVRGEKKSEREEKKDRSRWVERSYGAFARSFTLPANAAADRVEAGFKDGVLTLKIPKIEAAKPKVVSIKS